MTIVKSIREAISTSVLSANERARRHRQAEYRELVFALAGGKQLSEDDSLKLDALCHRGGLDIDGDVQAIKTLKLLTERTADFAKRIERLRADRAAAGQAARDAYEAWQTARRSCERLDCDSYALRHDHEHLNTMRTRYPHLFA